MRTVEAYFAEVVWDCPHCGEQTEPVLSSKPVTRDTYKATRKCFGESESHPGVYCRLVAIR